MLVVLGQEVLGQFGEKRSHVPYGTTKLYREGIENTDLERLGKLIKITGVFLQTKVYLFWGKPEI